MSAPSVLRTVAFIGIVERIYELAELKTGLTLSVSLHAATDEKRSEIMPVNKRDKSRDGGRAETAAHFTPHLCGDTKAVPVLVFHEYGFHRLPVGQSI